jgi:hypothetical protein
MTPGIFIMGRLEKATAVNVRLLIPHGYYTPDNDTRRCISTGIQEQR